MDMESTPGQANFPTNMSLEDGYWSFDNETEPSERVKTAGDLLDELPLKYNCTLVPPYRWDYSHVPFHASLKNKTQNSGDYTKFQMFLHSAINLVAPGTSVDEAQGVALVILVYFFVSLVGLGSSGRLLWSVSKKEHRKENTLWVYQANLAVAGIIVAGPCVWGYVLIRHMDGLHPGVASVLCQLNGFMQAMVLIGTTLTLSSIAVHQVIAVTFPLENQVKGKRGKKFWIIFISLIWLVSAAVSIPFAVYRELVTVKWQDHEQHVCKDTWPLQMKLQVDPNFSDEVYCTMIHFWRDVYYTMVIYLMFIIPMVIMGVCYTAIMVIMYKLKNSLGQDDPEEGMRVSNQSERNTQKDLAIMKSFFSLVGFAVLWGPFTIYTLYIIWTYDQVEGMLHTPEGEKAESTESKHWSVEAWLYLMAYCHPIVHPGLCVSWKDWNWPRHLLNGIYMMARLPARIVTSLANACKRRTASSAGPDIPLTELMANPMKSETAARLNKRNRVATSLLDDAGAYAWVFAESSTEV